MTSLANLTGSVAGGATDWTVPVRVRTEEMTFLRENVVRNRSVFNGSVYCDSEMDCGDCTSPNAWCQEMSEICDDSNCQYTDCVDGTVLEGGDDYLVGTLLFEPLCIITDDMTYQERSRP